MSTLAGGSRKLTSFPPRNSHFPSGPTTVTTVENVRYCSVGMPFDGATIKIDQPDEDGQGEVC